MNDINVFAVLVAALATFIIGGPWYAKPVFGTLWQREAGTVPQPRHPALVFAAAYVLSVIACAALAMHLGKEADWRRGLEVGAVIGIAFVATSFGINYAFGGRSVRLLAIDAGYHILQFAAFGLILGAWP
jgi:heme/copper-type cytochrome/quinol oxidase subunit 3